LTLNINNTGAKNVWAGGNLTSSSNPVTWSADATCEFVYFGNSWAYLGNDTDGYEDYQAGQAISDLAAQVGNVDVATDGDLQTQVDTLRDSVAQARYASWSKTFTFKHSKRSLLVLLNGTVLYGVWWPAGSLTYTLIASAQNSAVRISSMTSTDTEATITVNESSATIAVFSV
jgi:hypothetical protein